MREAGPGMGHRRRAAQGYYLSPYQTASKLATGKAAPRLRRCVFLLRASH